MIKKFLLTLFGKNNTAGDATEPKVLGQRQHKIDLQFVSKNAIRVTQTLQKAGFKAFIVGGAVRDLLLSVKPKDFDVATNATPEEVKKLFKRAFIIGRRFQIVHVVFGQEIIEVTTFRGTSNDKAPKDEYGRILRDNTFGEQHEDAVRRDFTINAMYYDPATQNVLDYHGGLADIRSKTLRMIGVPEARYREDPVRMLRVVRFAAKLHFNIDPATREPISRMAELIHHVPTARLFDEILKLLTSGHALACLNELQEVGLQHGLLPVLDDILKNPIDKTFITLALSKTDERVRQGKTVSPGFLFSALLWPQITKKWQHYRELGEYPIPALHAAADDVLRVQAEQLALQRKMTSDMRDIWAMQPRFEKRSGKSPYKLLEHVRLRAGFDFLLLRCASGETDVELGEWWGSFMNGNSAERADLLTNVPQKVTAAPVKQQRKPRTRRPRKPAAKVNNPNSSHE